ncbi:MAG: putative toxin-antitoxin system toxin component, PIN family [Gemmataceae bacterium]|nr:putative toxin-antitoxin system toxin component, PIN family [Gemmataceae bacterium]
MTTDPRFVIDTGVVVSALLLPRSVPRRAFDRAAAVGRLLVSDATVAELDRVLRRPKFDKYLREEERLEFLAAFVSEAERVAVSEVVRECRDPDDDKFLELAVSGRATHVISGDADLLVLNPFRGVPVVTPHDFLGQFPEAGG